MGKSEDQIVIQEVLSGNGDAYESLVKAHAQTLFRLAFRMTRDEADAEDVVQEALLRAYRKLATFNAQSSFGTWIYRITARCALDKIELRKRDQRFSPPESDLENNNLDRFEIPDPSAGPERNLLNHEISAISERALHSLTPVERSAFILRHMEGCTTVEIAEALNISQSSAKQAVFRAVQKLRQRLSSLHQQRSPRGIAHESFVSLD